MTQAWRGTRIGVLVSGRGSNLEALLRAEAGWKGAGRIEIVISSRPTAGALELAAGAGRRTEILPPPGEAADLALTGWLESAEVDLVVLAGYLRKVPDGIVERFRGRIVNVHPSLLPAFGGEGMYGGRVHEAVLAAGCTVSGATVHLVDEVYDSGPILAQWPVPVFPHDTADTLAERVQAVEHVLLPVVVHHLSEALGARRPPSRFHPPGPVFTVGEDAPDYQIRGQVARAFGER